MINAREEFLSSLRLGRYRHSESDGYCLMEAVAFLNGEGKTDSPECVCPVIAVFGRHWNDSLNDNDRNRLLLPYVTRLAGTNTGPADSLTRSYIALDWLVCTYTPAWLDLVPSLAEHATNLRALPPLIGPAAAQAAALAAALAASQTEALAAALAEAQEASQAEAQAEALAEALAAAQAAALAEAHVSATHASAALAASLEAWGAAWAAARDRLRPTVLMLQQSACDLLDRMIAVGKETQS